MTNDLLVSPAVIRPSLLQITFVLFTRSLAFIFARRRVCSSLLVICSSILIICSSLSIGCGKNGRRSVRIGAPCINIASAGGADGAGGAGGAGGASGASGYGSVGGKSTTI
ncbi:unnamed protein product [Closterium sp. NIES-54]